MSSTSDKKWTEAGAVEGMDMWRDGKVKLMEVNGKEMCAGRKPVGEEMKTWIFLSLIFMYDKRLSPKCSGFWRILV